MNRARGPVSEPAELLEEPVRSRAVELVAPLAGRPAGQQPAAEIPGGKVASPSPSASMAVPLRGSREGTAGPLVRPSGQISGRLEACHLVAWPWFSPPSKIIILDIDKNVHLDPGRLSSGPPRAQAAQERSLLAGRDSASPPDPERRKKVLPFFEHRGPVCTGSLPKPGKPAAAPLYYPGFSSWFPSLSSMASFSSSLASSIILSQFRLAPAARISRKIRDNFNSHTAFPPAKTARPSSTGACCKSPATSACLSGCPLYAGFSGAPTWQPAPGSLVLNREFAPGSREAGGVIPVQAPPPTDFAASGFIQILGQVWRRMDIGIIEPSEPATMVLPPLFPPLPR